MKIAIFCEGQSESLFSEWLVKSMAGSKGVRFTRQQYAGGKRNEKRIIEIEGEKPPDNFSIFVLVYDCGSDSRVLSEIREQYESLLNSGYNLVLGLRDVFPILPENLSDLERTTISLTPKGSLEAKVHFAKMEIEAWTLSDASILNEFGMSKEEQIRVYGCDPETMQIESLPHPFIEVKKAFEYVSIAYEKTKDQFEMLLGKMNFQRVSENGIHRVPRLKNFFEALSQRI